MPGPLRITFFGTYDERTHPRVAVLREGLSQADHTVEVVNLPLRLSTADRVDLVRRLWQAPIVGARLVIAWARLLGRSLRVRRPDAVVVGYLSHFDVHLARLRWPRAHIVVDYMVSLADTVRDRGIDQQRGLVKLLELIDRAATRQADTVVVDTAEHLAQLPLAHQPKALVVPVGAPQAWVAAGSSAVDSKARHGPLRVVFYGLYTPLQGATVIGEAIGKLAGHEISWTMIGCGQDRSATEAAVAAGPGQSQPDVTWVDWVDAADLPALVADHHVCLGIFGTGPKGRRVVPNKVFQGAAAGCALVTSDTPPQRAALGEAALFVPPGDAGALATVLAQLAADRSLVADRRRAALARASEHFVPAVAVGDLSTHLREAHDERMPRGSPAHPPLPANAALRWHLVRAHLDAIQPSSILELGTGQGAVASRLASRAYYVGVEPDATSRVTATARLDGRGQVVDDIGVVGDAEQFDLACAFEVLEHIQDDRATLAEWVNYVRPGGHVLVSVPAEPDRYGPFDELVGHLRRYSSDDLAEMLQAIGLEVVSVEHYGFPLGNLLEAGRNVIGRRRLAKPSTPADMGTRTAGSGRNLQPPTWVGGGVWWATLPFRVLQRRFPTRGPGLVGLARRPL